METPGLHAGEQVSKRSAKPGKSPRAGSRLPTTAIGCTWRTTDNPGHVGIRTKTHKLIYYYGCNYEGGYQTPPAWELYDMENDPSEIVNQYDNPEYEKVVVELKQRLADLRKRIGDTGEDHPRCEKILQDFWDYDGSDKAEAIRLSNAFKKVREEELKNRNNKKKGKGKKK